MKPTPVVESPKMSRRDGGVVGDRYYLQLNVPALHMFVSFQRDPAPAALGWRHDNMIESYKSISH